MRRHALRSRQAGLDKISSQYQVESGKIRFLSVTNPTNIAEKLRAYGLRPTRQRVFLGQLLFDGRNKHITPEMIADAANDSGKHIALGTIYNSLRQFAEAGLLKEVHGVQDRLVYDTNLHEHHHFLDVETGELTDVPADKIALLDLPELPDGFGLDAVEVTIRVKKSSPFSA